MARLLVTGLEGFVGGHLCRFLDADPRHQVFGSVLSHRAGEQLSLPADRVSVCDVLDPVAIIDLLRRVEPDAVFHLAGRAEVGKSWEDPRGTLQANIFGSLNLILGILAAHPHCRLMVVGSAGVYGKVSESDCPIKEEAPLQPSDPYSVSKAAQELLALQYFRSHDLQVIRVRPFNHIGPGQSPNFLVGRLAAKIAEIEAGQSPAVISIGNLASRRDFTDVRDVVRAYSLLLEFGEPGLVYNVASGQGVDVKRVVDLALGLSSRSIRLEREPALTRPADPPVLVGDSSLLRAATGWEPTMHLEKSIADALDHARAALAAHV